LAIYCRELYSANLALRQRSPENIDTLVNFARRHDVVDIYTGQFNMVCAHILQICDVGAGIVLLNMDVPINRAMNDSAVRI
jgi:hypothetical protein